MDAYAKDPTGFDNLMASMNTTGWYNTANLGTFAPHAQDATKGANAYYFAYDSQGGHEKPTTQNLQTVVCKIIPDTNAALVAFEAGQLDAFGSSALGANTVKSHEDDPRFNVFDSFGISGPVLLVFNLLNENLMKRDVRYSIASMLDKTEMTKINDGFSVPTWSPVWLVYDRFAPPQFKGAGPGGTDLSWYTPFEVPYSFETAKNLMRGEGYTVPDEFNYDTTGNKAPIDVVATTLLDVVSNAGSLGSNLYIGLSAFAITSVVLLRRRRDY
jgi:ABC-type transport system substrate-binding protein